MSNKTEPFNLIQIFPLLQLAPVTFRPALPFMISWWRLNFSTLRQNCQRHICWFQGSSFKGFLLFFLFSDWLKSNHLKSRIKRGFLDNFSRHIRNAVTEAIRVTNCATSFGAKKCSEDQVWSWWDHSWSVEPTIFSETGQQLLPQKWSYHFKFIWNVLSSVSPQNKLYLSKTE